MSDYLQYGCGFEAPEGWLNYDASPTLLFEKIPLIGGLYKKNEKRFPKHVIWGDIVQGLPHQVESVQGIFCSHILEHLSLEDCRKAIRNTFDYLKPGGVFRMVVPDLEYAINQYIDDKTNQAAQRFLEITMLGLRARGNLVKRIVESALGNSKHQWMWDEKALSHELKSVGFKKVRRAKFGDSTDPKFREVEREGRFINCLALEAIK